MASCWEEAKGKPTIRIIEGQKYEVKPSSAFPPARQKTTDEKNEDYVRQHYRFAQKRELADEKEEDVSIPIHFPYGPISRRDLNRTPKPLPVPTTRSVVWWEWREKGEEKEEFSLEGLSDDEFLQDEVEGANAAITPKLQDEVVPKQESDDDELLQDEFDKETAATVPNSENNGGTKEDMNSEPLQVITNELAATTVPEEETTNDTKEFRTRGKVSEISDIEDDGHKSVETQLPPIEEMDISDFVEQLNNLTIQEADKPKTAPSGGPRMSAGYADVLYEMFKNEEPIASRVVGFLHVADLNSLKYINRRFRDSLAGYGDFSWMLKHLNFGDEKDGAVQAFEGLRLLDPNKRKEFFWDVNGAQNVMENMMIFEHLQTVNLDNTGVDERVVEWILELCENIAKISIRDCQNIKLSALLNTLTNHAGKSRMHASRLRDVEIDYWDCPEIYEISFQSLVRKADLALVLGAQQNIRIISTLIKSPVFLCVRNHFGKGIQPDDIQKYRDETGGEDPGIFYPCEVRTIQCSKCNINEERRLCWMCWPKQICGRCSTHVCSKCLPETWVVDPMFVGKFCMISSYPKRKDDDPRFFNLAVEIPCCSEIESYYMSHYFHTQCWDQIKGRVLCQSESCRGERMVCNIAPSIRCCFAAKPCGKRQCPKTPHYGRKCQNCKFDMTYDTPWWFITPPIGVPGHGVFSRLVKID